MIQDYDPTLENVMGTFFGRCSHSRIKGNYCDDCSSFVQDSEIKEIQDLDDSLNASGIYGGVLLQKILDFLTTNSHLVIGTGMNGARHDFCMTVDGNKNVYTSDKNTFGQNVCWLAEILVRYLRSEGRSLQEIQRSINEK